MDLNNKLRQLHRDQLLKQVYNQGIKPCREMAREIVFFTSSASGIFEPSTCQTSSEIHDQL